MRETTTRWTFGVLKRSQEWIPKRASALATLAKRAKVNKLLHPISSFSRSFCVATYSVIPRLLLSSLLASAIQTTFYCSEAA